MNLFIIGAGDLGREVLQYALDAHSGRTGFRVAGFLDDRADALKGYEVGCRVVGKALEVEPGPENRFVIAVAEPGVRRRLAEAATARGARFATIVHPSAWVAPSAHIEDGCVVAPFAFVGVSARLEAHVVLNTYASAGHDAVIGRCTVLSPYAVVNGRVSLGESVFLGTHATVTPGRAVGAGSKIAAGSVVNRDVPPGSLAVGSPAKSRVLFGG